uniref:hypothetical protein n=1 Tax=Roseivirga sp. TaxID=1964215 RepID=UPI00404836FE
MKVVTGMCSLLHCVAKLSVLVKISDFVIQETLGEAFDKEAIRVLNLVGDWLPATFNSEPVKSQFSIKMKFKLDN